MEFKDLGKNKAIQVTAALATGVGMLSLSGCGVHNVKCDFSVTHYTTDTDTVSGFSYGYLNKIPGHDRNYSDEEVLLESAIERANHLSGPEIEAYQKILLPEPGSCKFS